MAKTSTERAREWRQNNRERACEISRRYDAKYKAENGIDRGTVYRRLARTSEKRSWLWLRWIKDRCRAKGVPFDLTEDDLAVPEFCPVLGIKLQMDAGRSDYGPSLDRFIPAKGYVRGNVCVISNRANRIKSDATLAELEAITAYLRGAIG